LRGSLLMAALGVAIGEILALSASRFVQPLLFDTSAKDVVVFSAVGALLLTVALVATLVPAFRARNVDPLEALRTE
jgi:putative ABC transport system permease protein